MTTTQCDLGIGIDLGTTFCAVTLFRGRKKIHMTFPRDGAQLPSAVYLDGSGTNLFGKAAMNAACRNPDVFYSHFKRGMVAQPDDPWNGGPSPVELSAHLLSYIWEVICKVNGDVKDYVPDLGGTRDPALLKIAVTHPATYHLEAQAALQNAIDRVGAGFRVDTLISEPVAGSYVYREERGDRLNPGDLVAVLDFGGGTFDCSVLQFNRGVFDQVVGAKGDEMLGGLNFTGELFLFGDGELGLGLADAYDSQRGLALSRIAPEKRREAAELWEKVNEAKHELSVGESSTVFVQTDRGLREFTIRRDNACALWERAKLFDRFDATVADVVNDTPYRWGDIQHVVLMGGSALVPGLAQRIAAKTGRDVAEIFVSGDPSHVVADGAAFQTRMQEKTALCLPGGLGVELRDPDDPKQSYFKFFYGTGEPVPLDGRPVEQLGQFVVSVGRPASLRLSLVESKPGVRVPRPNGSIVLLTRDEVVPVTTIGHAVELPKGRHAVKVGFYHEPNGACHYRFIFPDLPDADVIDGKVESNGASSASDQGEAYDLLVLLDCSSSMEGSALQAAKDAVLHLLQRVAAFDIRVGLVSFGRDTKLACPLGSDLALVGQAAQGLSAKGSTPMHTALSIAANHIEVQPPHRRRLVALVTDGHPDDHDKAMGEAQAVKSKAELITIGIGPKAAAHFLTEMASQPQDYYFGASFDDLDGIFDQIVELYLDAGVLS